MAYAAPAAFSLGHAHYGADEDYRISHPEEAAAIQDVVSAEVASADVASADDLNDVGLTSPAHLDHTSSASTAIQPMEIDGTNAAASNDAGDDGFNPKKEHSLEIDDQNKKVDPHGLRSATWQSCFFLIITDLFGPAKLPWSYAQLGYVPGTMVYLFLGLISLYCSMLLWQMYMRLDEPGRRILTYSDLGERIFGRKSRHVMTIMQSLMLLFNVSAIILSNAQGLSQIAEAKVCFIVLALLWMIGGMVVGQVRALQNFRFLSNIAVILNFAVIFIVLAVVHHTVPNYSAALSQNGVPFGAIAPVAFISGTKWTQQLVGVMQAVYAYGGAEIFLEMMAEMKEPKDFIKSMVSAQTVIIIAYIVFGVVVYSKQGQFVINPASQGLSIYSWQTVCNVFSLISALIAAALYGNVGIKVLYQSVVRDMFNGPELTGRRGNIIWGGMAVGYWVLAFVISSGIPQLSNISGLIAALCMQHFSFTFPIGMKLGMDWQSMEGQTFWKKCTFVNTAHFVTILASLACAGLGAYSSVLAIVDSPSASVAFGCTSPV